MKDEDKYLRETELRKAREYNDRKFYCEKTNRLPSRISNRCLVVFIIIGIMGISGCTNSSQSGNTGKLVKELNQKYAGKPVTFGTKTEIYNLLGDCRQEDFNQLRYWDFYFDDDNIKMTLRKAGMSLTYYKFELIYGKVEP
jgi:hypothetical protein